MKVGTGKQGTISRKLSFSQGGDIDRSLLDFDPFLKEIFSLDTNLESGKKNPAPSGWFKRLLCPKNS